MSDAHGFFLIAFRQRIIVADWRTYSSRLANYGCNTDYPLLSLPRLFAQICALNEEETTGQAIRAIPRDIVNISLVLTASIGAKTSRS